MYKKEGGREEYRLGEHERGKKGIKQKATFILP
jgi:hypothetical protein